MYQVITIGSALVDVFIHTRQFRVMATDQGDLLCQTHGGKTEVDNFNVYTGGGAGNTAVGFARLGFKTATICETGRDNFSYLVIKDLQDQGVSTELIVSEKQEQTGGSVVLIGADGERSILV
ncbi:MAG TPA: carbohydrate kinase family protein, partial [Candidatus Woesebacteria bacterium]|nr:carbohydrate kinase family protein [Candidatus Woesebacteria bacterium]